MRQKIWFVATVAALMMPAIAGAQQSSQSSSQPAQTPQTSDKKAAAQSTPAQAAAPTTAAKPDSLAEAARKARAAEKAAPKATVFTNDNLPTQSSAVSVVGQAAASSSDAAGNNASGATPAAAGDEAAWRQKFADARHKIDQDKQDLALMQREMGELNVQYYTSPTQALMQSISRSDIDKKQAAIDAKQKELAADEQALSNLQDELRKAGGDPGWARE